jgi:hypothetical protein
MADPSPNAPPNYPNAPPPPPTQYSPAGGYPPQGYPGWQGAPPPQYRPPMLPAWLTFGTILAMVGGVLVLVGFILETVADSSIANSTAANAYTSFYNSMAASNALIGVGIFVVILGWMFHQMALHRQTAH